MTLNDLSDEQKRQPTPADTDVQTLRFEDSTSAAMISEDPSAGDCWSRLHEELDASSSRILPDRRCPPIHWKVRCQRRASRRWMRRRAVSDEDDDDHDDHDVHDDETLPCRVCHGCLLIGKSREDVYNIDNTDIEAHCSCLCARNHLLDPHRPYPSVSIVQLTDDDAALGRTQGDDDATDDVLSSLPHRLLTTPPLPV